MVEHPACRESINGSGFDTEADESSCKDVQDHHDPVTAQENRFAAEEIDAPEAILGVADESQPRWTRVTGVAGSVVSGKDAADDILVDLDAEGMSDLLSDSHAAETRIAPLHFDDGRDELGRLSFRAGLGAMRRGGKEQAAFLMHQRFVELEQRCRLDERASFGVRRGLTNSVVSPSTTRSRVVRFGARWRERLLMSS